MGCWLAFRACGYQKILAVNLTNHLTRAYISPLRSPDTMEIYFLLKIRFRSRTYRLLQHQSRYSTKKSKSSGFIIKSVWAMEWIFEVCYFLPHWFKAPRKNIWHSTQRLCFFLEGSVRRHKTQGTYRECDPEHCTHFFLPPFSLKDFRKLCFGQN